MSAARTFRPPLALILLLANLLAGLAFFRDYGLSWDEPLFYDYADALRYAYSPREWLNGDFDLNRAFGASGSDHANRGPAYIILARPFVSLFERLGADMASAWHLVNFLTFQFGVYLFYRLTRRFASEPAAAASAALFAWQPLLWGHAFINPKDPPFLVFFLGAVLFGFEAADALTRRDALRFRLLASLFLAAFFLGAATSVRVLGPLAGALVGLYALGRLKEIGASRLMKVFALYALTAALVSLALWPYLWGAPLQRFVEVFGFMSANPTHLPVLFGGQVYPADELPRRYLPVLLALTLTEPVLPLFLLGLFFAFRRPLKTDAALRSADDSLTSQKTLSAFVVLLWFLVPFSYVLLRKPPMYDGYRHFLFMLPPLFVFGAFAFEKIFDALRGKFRALALLLFVPAVFSAVALHPYQYAYYNSFVGGVGGAFRRYETEYWLTCYKEAVEKFPERNVNLFVKREPYIAAYYARGIAVRDYRAEFGKIQPGDFALVNTRTNEDLKTFRAAPIALQVARAGAVFCEVKKIP